MAQLDRSFGLSDSDNRYIAARWFELAVASDYEPAWPAVRDYLLSIGRMKLINPIDRELAKTEAGLEKARQVFAEARAGYHPIASNAIAAMLESAP